MSQTISSVFVILLAQLLPKFGVNLGSAELTTTVQVLLTVGAALWVWVRRVQAGGVGVFGARQ